LDLVVDRNDHRRVAGYPFIDFVVFPFQFRYNLINHKYLTGFDGLLHSRPDGWKHVGRVVPNPRI
jgi:hypothetical protein